MGNQITLEHLENLYSEGKLLGVFENVPLDVYHEAPGISSTQVKRAFKSINHYTMGMKETAALRFGSAFHAMQDGTFDQEYSVGRYHSTKKVIDPEDYALIKRMTLEIHNHPYLKNVIGNSLKEVSFWAIDPVTELLVKCRADEYYRANSKPIALDWKSTRGSAEAESFSFDARKLKYRISAAFYLHVMTLATGEEHRDFLLGPCEKDEPWNVGVHRVHDSSIEKGFNEFRLGLSRIAEYESNKKQQKTSWNGYDLTINDILI